MSQKTDTLVACTIGIDTGKNTLHLIGLDNRGAIVLREKLTRGRIAARLANVPQCLIGIEAGMATHCVARELIALGHDVKQRTCLARGQTVADDLACVKTQKLESRENSFSQVSCIRARLGTFKQRKGIWSNVCSIAAARRRVFT